MSILEKYNEENVEFIETMPVKEGVICHVYSFPDDPTKDLGLVQVQKGFKTPKQKVIGGTKTLEIFKSGKGILKIENPRGTITEYYYPNNPGRNIEVFPGETMQWEALEDLEFYELCWPPYQEGRFENLD